MGLSRLVFCGVASVILTGATLLATETKSSNTTVATQAVYVPNMSKASGPLPEGVLAWNATIEETNLTANIRAAHFVFDFTNVSTQPVVLLSVRPSCGCTTTKLPPLPWTLTPSTNSHMEAVVNLPGQTGLFYKSLTVHTDRGSKMLLLKINIRPFTMPVMSEVERARNVQIARADRQAVFRGKCATCHVELGQGKYGKPLYDADCAICHEGKNRASIVPDLHTLKTPTSLEFWRTWIAHGKPGSLMPAFSTVDGGPLSDIQISSLASYLNEVIPSKSLPASK